MKASGRGSKGLWVERGLGQNLDVSFETEEYKF